MSGIHRYNIMDTHVLCLCIYIYIYLFTYVSRDIYIYVRTDSRSLDVWLRIYTKTHIH